MSLSAELFRVAPGERVNLSQRQTRIEPPYGSKRDYHRMLGEHVAKLGELQQAHYAAERAALLVVIQAMDAGGKDGVIRHVLSGVNPQGCRVTSFKRPSEAESRHDFLWRTTLSLPERGQIGVFNRSYYEEVLVVRVHPALLRAQGVHAPDEDALWTQRFGSINDMEAHLGRNGTRIVKVFLHLSKAEQRLRFLRRIKRAQKRWKLEPADMAERAHWDDYVRAYEACLSATSTDTAPWLIVPADDKRTARLIVAQAVLEALQALHPAFPEADAGQRRALKHIREQLEAEAPDPAAHEPR